MIRKSLLRARFQRGNTLLQCLGMIAIAFIVLIAIGMWHKDKLETDPKFRAEYNAQQAEKAEEPAKRVRQNETGNAGKAGRSLVPGTGQEGVARNKKAPAERVMASASKEIDDQITKAAGANDIEGIKELMLAGLAYTLAPETGVLVLDLGIFVTKVRITTGPHSGEVAWIQTSELGAPL